jgi:hypothetical protein
MTVEELMNGGSELDRFLQTDPRDVGCAQAMEMLHIYAELTAAGEPAEQRYRASRRICVRAAPAMRISKVCWPHCTTRRTEVRAGLRSALATRAWQANDPAVPERLQASSTRTA